MDNTKRVAEEGGVGRYRTTASLSVEASCSTVAVFIPFSLQLHSSCLKLQTYYCTSVSTSLLDMPDHEVNIIAATDGYSCILSVPV